MRAPQWGHLRGFSSTSSVVRSNINSGIEEIKISEPIGGRMETEYLQFGGALVLFLAILIGSYWFVYLPNRRGQEGEDDG